MKKGNEKKKLNRFLSVNLSLVMCLSSIPASYTVVAADEGDETEPGTGSESYSVCVKDLFGENVEGAQVGLSLSLENGETIGVNLDSASTDADGVVEIQQADIKAALDAWMVDEEITDEPVYTMIYTASKDGYAAGDSVEVTSDEAYESGVDLELAQLCDLKGTLDFIGANMTDFVPVYSISYSFKNIEKYLQKDEDGNPIQPELETDGTNFTLKNAPISQGEVELTVTPGEELEVPAGSEYSSYRQTTKTFELNSQDDAKQHLNLKVEPDVLRVSFPSSGKQGSFSNNGVLLEDHDYSPEDLKRNKKISFKFNPAEGMTLQKMELVVYNAEEDKPSIEEVVGNRIGTYSLNLANYADAYMIRIRPVMEDNTAPFISTSLMNNADEGKYVPEQGIDITVEEAVSETVTVTLWKLIEGTEDSEPGQDEVETAVLDVSEGQASYHFDIKANGTYWITATDENNNTSDTSAADPDTGESSYIKIENLDDEDPVSSNVTVTAEEGKDDVVVSFKAMDPDNSDGTAGSGIRRAQWYIQNDLRPVMTDIESEDGSYEFRVPKDSLARCVVVLEDGAGRQDRFSPDTTPYLDVSVKDANVWSNEKVISYTLKNTDSLSDDSEISIILHNTSTNGLIKDVCKIYDGENGSYKLKTKNLKGEFTYKGERRVYGVAAAGKFTVEMIISDENGEISIQEPVEIDHLDVAKPQLVIPAMDDEGFVWLSNSSLTVTAGDLKSGIDRIEVFRKDGPDSDYERIFQKSGEGNPGENKEYTLSMIKEGETVIPESCTYVIEVFDSAGNSERKEVGVKTDNTPPEIDVENAEFETDGYLFMCYYRTLSFKVSDDQDKNVDVKVITSKNGSSLTTTLYPDENGNYTFTFSPEYFDTDIFGRFRGRLTIVASDKAGNDNYYQLVNGELVLVDQDDLLTNVEIDGEFTKENKGWITAKESNFNVSANVKKKYLQEDLAINKSLIDSIVVQKKTYDNGKWSLAGEPVTLNGKSGEIFLTTQDTGDDSVQNKIVINDQIDTSPDGEIQLQVTVNTKFGVSKSETMVSKLDIIAPQINLGNLDPAVEDDKSDTKRPLSKRVFAEHALIEKNVPLVTENIELSSVTIEYNGDLYSEDGSKKQFKKTITENFGNDKENGKKASFDLKYFDPLEGEPEKTAFEGTVTITATDIAGQSSSLTSAKFIIDRMDPKEPKIVGKTGENEFYSDAAGTEENDGWTNKPVTLHIDASHAPGGIKEIEIAADGKETETSKLTTGDTCKAINTSVDNMSVSVKDPNDSTDDGSYNGTYTVTITTYTGKTSSKTFTVKQDLTAPENLVITDSAGEELSEHDDNAARYTKFYKTPQEFSFSADFEISGMKSELYKKAANGDSSIEWQSFVERNKVDIGVNERFELFYQAIDNATNKSEFRSEGIIIDNQEPEISYVLPAANKKGFYNSAVTVKINAADPRFKGDARADDDDADGVYSGLNEVTYTISSASTGAVETGTLYSFGQEESEDTKLQKWDDLARVMDTAITIDPQKFNANDVVLSITAVDNSGNEKTVSTEVGDIQIDVTAPTIDVAYDNNNVQNGHYYSADRTATIVITERNFDPEDVKLTVTSSNSSAELPVLSSWTTQEAGGNQDGTTHTATITYHDDADYTFNIEYTDLADNAASGVNYAEGTNNPTEFTVDQTKPVIKVEYDNNDAQNGNFYKASRTATITVTEHNFDSEKVNIDIKAVKSDLQGTESSVSQPSKSSWTTAGDTHTQLIEYSEDADYTFNIKMTDLAENANDDVAEQKFTVDKVFDGFRVVINYGDADGEKSHKNNDSASPANDFAYQNLYRIFVEYEDINLKAGEGKLEHQTWIDKDKIPEELKEQEVSGGTTTEKKLMRREMQTSISKERTSDGIYFLNASADDMAGNSKKADLSFSLSKFGSLYMYDENLTALQDDEAKYITDVKDNLRITELNPSGLKDDTIDVVLSRDGNVVEMTEDSNDKSGAVTEKKNDGLYDTNSKWYEYEHVISKDNFENEGVYAITLSSTDQAGTISKNTANETNAVNKDKKQVEPEIQFYVDKNPPTLDFVNGIDSNNFNASERQVSYSVSDSIGLKKVEVYSVNTKTHEEEMLDAHEFAKGEDDKNFKGEVTVRESSDGQKLHIVITDKAGQVTDSEKVNANSEIYPKEFVMSTNWWVLFVHNKPLFYGTLAALIAIIAGGTGYFLIKNRRNDEDEEDQDTAAI